MKAMTRRAAISVLGFAATAVAMAVAPRQSAMTTTFTWTADRHGQFTWDGAVAAAAAYADEGSTEWRLPTIDEARDAMMDGSYGPTEVINGSFSQYTNRSQGQWNTVVRASTDASGYPIPSTVTTKKVLRTSWLLCKFVHD